MVPRALLGACCDQTKENKLAVARVMSGGLGRRQRVQTPTPGKRQLGQVVPSILCTISLGSRAGVLGLEARGLLQKGWG